MLLKIELLLSIELLISKKMNFYIRYNKKYFWKRQSNMTNNLNLMQSSTIRITKISEYVDVQKILASDTAH